MSLYMLAVLAMSSCSRLERFIELCVYMGAGTDSGFARSELKTEFSKVPARQNSRTMKLVLLLSAFLLNVLVASHAAPGEQIRATLRGVICPVLV